MLRFNAKQFRQLEALRQQRFDSDALAHVREHFADRFAEFGNDPCEALLQHALREAAQHGFSLRPDVLKYVSLVFEYGPTFGHPANFGWAHDILVDRLPGRMERLYAAAAAQAGDPA